MVKGKLFKCSKCGKFIEEKEAYEFHGYFDKEEKIEGKVFLDTAGWPIRLICEECMEKHNRKLKD